MNKDLCPDDPEHACKRCASVVPNRATLRHRGIGIKRRPAPAKGGLPNFHTHIGRPVLNEHGEPVMTAIGIKHGGRWRIKYEYVPRFSDPGETARVMVMAAARKAKLDARRERMAPHIAATEGRRGTAHMYAVIQRRVRDTERTTRRTRAVAAGRKGWTLPRRLREQVADHAE